MVIKAQTRIIQYRLHLKPAIPNLGVKQGVGYAWRRCRQQGQIFAPRQLLSYKDVTNAENAGAFFCRQAPMDGFTAFLDRDTPHPNPVRMLKLGIADLKPYH
ncbi:hypothetical protein [Methylotuvimicrobium sp. KM1]|uniref:hypothetical protein n=1 Tax=Methylotuvimicrobium sp. KM1 TaxID=3377707 RepID=UPI0038516CA1